MASSGDPSKPDVAYRKQKGPQFKYLFPLIYAPVLPLIRLGLRRNRVLRDRLFTIVLAGGFAHGCYLVYPSFILHSSLDNLIIYLVSRVVTAYALVILFFT